MNNIEFKASIQKAKKFPIPAMLEYFGHIPCREKGSELYYFSPFRDEKTPSFLVNIKGNVTNDFGDKTFSGDAIRLYQNLTKCTFLNALHDLCNNKININTGSNLIKYAPIIQEKKQIEIKEIKEKITDRNLIEYLESRCINPETANLYCKEVHYKQTNGKIYKSIGFKNDSGGYELRGANFKACLGSKDITTIKSNITTSIALFEGFFDFLSYMEFNKKNPIILESGFNKIILNSNSLIQKVKKDRCCIYSFLDNDNSGIKTFEKLKEINPNCIISNMTKNLNLKTDLNDYLIEQYA
jgi:hypothetical protein